MSTFVIPRPHKHQNFAISEQQKQENRVSRTEALAAWLTFAKEVAGHFKKGWFVELKDGKDEHLYVNGHSVSAKFKGDYLLVSNSQSMMGIKKVVQLYYGVNLTLKNHGARLVAVINDIIARDIKYQANSDKSQANMDLGVEIMKELVRKHNFRIIDPENEEAGGYRMTADPHGLSFKFYTIGDKWSPTWRIDYNIETGKAKLSIGADGLNMKGDFNDIADATGKLSIIVGLVNQMGREFVTITEFVPGIIKRIKGG